MPLHYYVSRIYSFLCFVIFKNNQIYLHLGIHYYYWAIIKSFKIYLATFIYYQYICLPCSILFLIILFLSNCYFDMLRITVFTNSHCVRSFDTSLLKKTGLASLHDRLNADVKIIFHRTLGAARKKLSISMKCRWSWLVKETPFFSLLKLFLVEACTVARRKCIGLAGHGYPPERARTIQLAARWRSCAPLRKCVKITIQINAGFTYSCENIPQRIRIRVNRDDDDDGAHVHISQNIYISKICISNLARKYYFTF